jgi:hypothetical protein
MVALLKISISLYLLYRESQSLEFFQVSHQIVLYYSSRVGVFTYFRWEVGVQDYWEERWQVNQRLFVEF